MLALAACLPASVAQSTAPQQTTSSLTAEAHLGKGYEALKLDRYEVAVEEFRAALALDSSLVLRAQFPLAVALFEQHKPVEARRELEGVRKQIGDHPNVSYYLGRLDIDDLDYASAIKNFSLAISTPPFPDTAYYLGFAYLKQNDLPNAEKFLKEAAQLSPRDSRVPYQLGLVYRKQGREDEAKKSLELSSVLRRQDDTEAQLRTECADKLEKGSREDARAVCDKLYHDDDADRLTSLGMIYAQHKDFDAALKPFQRAAELSPHSPQVQYNLSLTYFQMDRFAEARQPLEQALKRWPDLFPLNALYGATLLKLDDEDKAFDILKHAQELNPQDAGTADSLYFLSLKLAEKSAEAKRYTAALNYLNEATKLRPQEPQPHAEMAEAFTHLGKTAEATAQRKEAEKLAGK